MKRIYKKENYKNSKESIILKIFLRMYCLGDSSEVATPLPIPNRAVKHFSADDSPFIWVKVGRRQDYTFEIK